MAKYCNKTKTKDGVEFNFTNGKLFEVSLASLSEDMIQQLAIHGLSQKLGDSYASSSTVSECIEKFTEQLGHLESGVFNAGRQAGGSADTILAEAFVALMANAGVEKTVDECLEAIGKMDKKTKAKFAKRPDIAKEVLIIKLANADEVPEPKVDDVQELISDLWESDNQQ